MKGSTRRQLLQAGLAGLTVAPGVKAAPAGLGDWPQDAAPQRVGPRLAENLLRREHMLYPNQTLHYAEVVTWLGALQLAGRLKNETLLARLAQRFAPLMAPGNPLVPPANHVDFSVFGVLPLELYRQTGDARLRMLGLSFADAQWDRPVPGGLTNQTRFWVDDIYMITALQGAAYRATGDTKYLDRAALQTTVYLNVLQQPNGLFHHAENAPFFWGRGNGWYAAGMAELLRLLPASHPQQAPILQGYRRMMDALLPLQAEQGLWRQLLDRPNSWLETSGSAMFCFAFVVGVQQGWLPADRFAPAARKAWLALAAQLTDTADLRETSVGTGAANDEQHYLNRPRAVGDLHGQAPMVWTAGALLGEMKA